MQKRGAARTATPLKTINLIKFYRRPVPHTADKKGPTWKNYFRIHAAACRPNKEIIRCLRWRLSPPAFSCGAASILCNLELVRIDLMLVNLVIQHPQT